MSSKILPKIALKSYPIFDDMIKLTKKTNNEHGVNLCDLGTRIEPQEKGVCRGTDCEVKIRIPCKNGFNQGVFHTHPYNKRMIDYLNSEEYYELALDIYSSDILLHNDFYDFRDFLKNYHEKTNEGREFFEPYTKPRLSWGDLAKAVVESFDRESNGTSCVSVDTGSKEVLCSTIKNVLDITKEQYQKAINEWDTKKHYSSSEWDNTNLFQSERVNINSQLKKRNELKKLYDSEKEDIEREYKKAFSSFEKLIVEIPSKESEKIYDLIQFYTDKLKNLHKKYNYID